MADDTSYIRCYGCADTFWDRGSDPGWTETQGVYTDARTGRTFCADCALELLWWMHDGMPEAEYHCSYAEWIDLPRAVWESA